MASDLSLRVLGDCDQGVINEFQFYGGEDRTIKLQIYDTINDQRWCIPSGVEMTLYFPSSTGVDIEIPHADITIDPDCPTTILADLSAAQTTNMMTGWIKLKIELVGGLIRWAYRSFGTKKLG